MISHTFPCSLLPSGNQKCNSKCHLRADRQAHLPLDQRTVFVEPPLFLSCLDGWYLVLYHHCHIDNSVCDDTLWGMILVHFHHFFHDLKYGKNNDYLLYGALLNALLWDQSHNFNDFLNNDGLHPSISNLTTSLRSTLEEHSLSTYCTSTRGTCT